MPYADIRCSVPEIDFYFTTYLSCASRVIHLDLTKCSISTLGYLLHMPYLEILQLSECHNLLDPDFMAISNCTRLQHLHLGFTSVRADTTVCLVKLLPLIKHLDFAGVEFTLIQSREILQSCRKTLKFLSLSLVEGATSANFHREVSSAFRSCHCSIVH